MPQITRDLLRKRSEHNEGLISTLEEITLHQEELEGINEVLGFNCKRLKILYLQNNIIPRIENLIHLKDLQYLNLALNNITKIEGLQNCEFLKKLDLTVNFIDVDELEDSIKHLSLCDRLRELYMMGNPAQANWPGFESYVIAKLPQLELLDGKEITKSMQIIAKQKLPLLEEELEILSAQKRLEKSELCKVSNEYEEEIKSAGVIESEKLTENTPEVRVEIYKELAQQKKEKEDRDKANQPRERDYESEHSESVSNIRAKEESADGSIKQKNEGGWEFTWDEENRSTLILEVKLPKFLDNSLIDVDIHPHYISIVIKSKLLRLQIPDEIKVNESKCQRSKLTGSLKVIMPKVSTKTLTLISKSTESKTIKSKSVDQVVPRTKFKNSNKVSIQEQMMIDAMQATSLTDQDFGNDKKNIDIFNIVKKDIEEDSIVFNEVKSNTTNRIEEI